jgi:hypothetical protein
MIQETLRFTILAAMFSLTLVGVSLLAACSEMKYAGCIVRDNTRNPCN